MAPTMSATLIGMTILLFALAVPAVLACGYLLALTILSAAPLRPAKSSRQTRFDVFVPAHNEAAVIQRTVSSLSRLDWPANRFRIVVIADNCTDETAAVAHAAGAKVLARHNTTQRGKGYALAFAFEQSRRDQWADAVVVIDADAEVSTNLLEAFAARLEQGADAVQAHYGVLNPMASWRTRLVTIAKGSFHIVRSRARERLGVSSGIRGNGWCVTHRVLTRVPYAAFSLTEDLEYGIDLGVAGIRVHYVDEAHSNADMVSGEAIARKQRQRWEDGRFQLVRSRTLPLLKEALRQPSLVCLDLAFDLLVLPLSYVTLNVFALALLAIGAAWWHPELAVWLWLSVACVAALAVHVLRGWQLSGIGAHGFIDLLRVPGFLVWKIVLLTRRSSTEWVRTDRESS